MPKPVPPFSFILNLTNALKDAKMVVQQAANSHCTLWQFCVPSRRTDEEISFHVLGSSPALGFVVVDECKHTVKAFDEDMNILKTQRFK